MNVLEKNFFKEKKYQKEFRTETKLSKLVDNKEYVKIFLKVLFSLKTNQHSGSRLCSKDQFTHDSTRNSMALASTFGLESKSAVQLLEPG